MRADSAPADEWQQRINRSSWLSEVPAGRQDDQPTQEPWDWPGYAARPGRSRPQQRPDRLVRPEPREQRTLATRWEPITERQAPPVRRQPIAALEAPVHRRPAHRDRSPRRVEPAPSRSGSRSADRPARASTRPGGRGGRGRYLPRRNVRAFLLATVAAAVAVAGAGELIIDHFTSRGDDRLAQSISAITTSQSAAQLEQALQVRIRMTAASKKFNLVGTAGQAMILPPAGGAPTVYAPPPAPGTVQAIAYNMLPDFGFNPTDQYGCVNQIFTRESDWTPTATNPSSGAYGIPQSLPGYKMAQFGSDWQTNPATQIRWGLWYMKTYYGSPCNAWLFWQGHNAY